ncbi:MAG: cobalt-precorrin-5B (C(1))-methyltransferase CbiD [Thermodesulfovibrionales bacterium]|nr:cobalt-precorrin-5B (C(1))-methyltransferase CbiD [Thermodesulfovibrionales bacterium]
MKGRPLYSGYTTGACATACAKAAAQLLIRRLTLPADQFPFERNISNVDITLPVGIKASFKIDEMAIVESHSEITTQASTIKFSGDDPDVTNGAKIIAQIILKKSDLEYLNKIVDRKIEVYEPCKGVTIDLEGGKGVGIVTKPGLPVPIGLPAINPVPNRMIIEAVEETLEELKDSNIRISNLKIIISVPEGEKLALKTLNPRLGIIGGISILGTTGIVKPLSSEAWKATISTSMDVAKATGRNEIVLSTGRVSEKAHMRRFNFPEESYVMMGDYLEFSLLEAKRRLFKRIHLCSQWAKMLKIAMSTPHTHVKYGVIDTKKVLKFLTELGIDIPVTAEFNTAREIFQFMASKFNDPAIPLKVVCSQAKRYAEKITEGIPVILHLVNYDNEVFLSLYDGEV